LHPLYGGTADGVLGESGGRKNIFKNICLGVGEDKKMITFAARFGRNGDKKMERKGCPAGRPRYTGGSLT